MPRDTSHETRRSPSNGYSDDGFTLIELMVALLVLIIVLAPLTGSLVTAVRTSKQSQQAVLAADLLSQTLDGVRSAPFADVPIGTTSTTQTVDGTGFTVTQTVKPIAAPEATTNVCGASSSGGGSGAYLLVSVAVSWSHTNATPVMGRTMLAPPATVIASGDAEAIIQVTLEDGNAAVGVPVTINTVPAQTVNTDINGCASFPYLNAGQSYTLTAAGYDEANTANAIEPASITSPAPLTLNQVWQPVATWDQATTLTGPVQTDCLTSTAPNIYGPCLPTIDVIYPTSCLAGATACTSGMGPGSSVGPIPVVFQPFGASSSTRVLAGATSPAAGASTAGFPYSADYEAWAGTCADAQPTNAFVEGLTSDPNTNALVWVPGNPAVTLFAQPLTAATDGRTVTASHANDPSSCTSGELYTYFIPTAAVLTLGGYTAVAIAMPVGGSWTVAHGGVPPATHPGVVIPPISMAGLS